MAKNITDRHYPLAEYHRSLTSKYARVKPDNVLAGVTLYDHQCVIIAAMIDIENKRKFTLSNGDIVYSTSGLLSEPGGSGKTFICIALIMLQKLPKAFPQVYGVLSQSQQIAITRKITTPGALIQSTLIIVSTSVYKQWYQSISERTSSLIYCVENYYGMCEFQKMLEKKVISRYPIVLLRSATISGSFEIDGVTYPNQARSSLELMNLMTRKYCWGRVINDDYDTNGTPGTAPIVNSLFTWYVSASRRNAAVPTNQSTQTITELVTRDPIVMDALRCPLLNGIYNIRVTTKFRKMSKSIPSVKFYRYVYENPDDAYIRALHGDDDAGRELVQMLNGDAVGEAAAAIGIEATCIADIFKKMLDTKYDSFILARKRGEFLEQQRELLDELDEREDRRQHSDETIAEIKKNIDKLVDPKVTYYSQKLEMAYSTFAAEYSAEAKKNGIAVDRMIDNIRMGGCQVCKLDLADDTAVFIVKCCGLIICSICFPRACKVGSHYVRAERGAKTGGLCAQCNRYVDLKKDVIFLDRNFNIDKLLTATGDESAPVCEDCSRVPCACAELAEAAAEAEAAAAADGPPVPCIKDIRNPKVRALLQIIAGETPDMREEFRRTNMVLMEGDEYVPQPPHIPKKVIVFAHYEETLDKITEQLVIFGIKFLRIAGGADEVFNTLRNFRTGNYTVLLINSSQRCAGMDMPFVTDEVFMHEVIDKHVAGQLAARAQRFGRECSLNIHYLCYRNEVLLV